MRYYDGRGPLPPAGIQNQPWRGPSVTARRLRGPTALYRFFATDGRLIYVGITQDLEARWRGHSRSVPWWHLQARVAVEWLPTRAEAERAERVAIRDERPLFNYVHSMVGAGRKATRHTPEWRRRPQQKTATDSVPVWEPSAEQVEAMAAVTAAAATAGRRELGPLHHALLAAWDVGVPGRELASLVKQRPNVH